jgi:hypothetical protein
MCMTSYVNTVTILKVQHASRDYGGNGVKDGRVSTVHDGSL